MCVLKGKFASGLRFHNNILADMFKINAFNNLLKKSRTENRQLSMSQQRMTDKIIDMSDFSDEFT
jgi:hypothetical protein